MFHIKLADSCRGAAAIAVFADHLIATLVLPHVGVDGYFNKALGVIGEWSVNAFFLLSGYFITHSILANTKSNGRFKWQDYFLSRVARIYPPLIASVIICLAVYWIVLLFDLHGRVSFRLPTDLYVIRENISLEYREIIYSLLMIGGLGSINGPLWSLYIEWNLYLQAMFLAILVSGRISYGWKLVVIGLQVIAVARLSAMSAPSTYILYLIWVLGAIFAFSKLWKRPASIANLRLYNHRGLKLAGLILIALIILIRPSLLLNSDASFMGLGAKLLLAFSLAYVWFKQRTNSALISWLEGTGKYSYTLYIIHFPLGLLIFSLTHQYSQMVQVVLVCVCSFVLIMYLSKTLSIYVENKKYFEALMKK